MKKISKFYEPRHDALARRASAKSLIRYVLACSDSQAFDSHINELLKVMLWKLTEAESKSKHKTRFQSAGARDCADRRRLRHEHVFQMNKMIGFLRAAKSDEEVDRILGQAVGCTVTAEEHKRLAEFDSHYGWKRYCEAGIEVFDTESGKQVDLCQFI